MAASNALMPSMRSFTSLASLASGSFSRYFSKNCMACSYFFAFSKATAALNRKAPNGFLS